VLSLQGVWSFFFFYKRNKISIKSAIKYTGSIQERHLRGRRKQYKEIIYFEIINSPFFENQKRKPDSRTISHFQISIYVCQWFIAEPNYGHSSVLSKGVIRVDGTAL